MLRAGTPVGKVQALYRYPVKSTAGQALSSAVVTTRGLRHDRGWAAYTDDGGVASGKRTRRFRPVVGLMAWASLAEDDGGVPVLVSPDGARHPVDDPAASAALSAAFGQRLMLRPEGTVPHHDESPIHLLTSSSIAALESRVDAPVDHRRFRANIIIDTGSGPAFLEDDWSGAELVIGETVLQLGPAMPRCVMVDQAQAEVGGQPKVLRSLGAHHDAAMGLQALVSRTGTLHIGDAVVLRRPART
ncbi:MOSC domain-containing protein [Modestobacter sp. SYSU DS0290]